ncbi:MAG TPA: hypothetical protein DIW81_01330 [Planctomycetaceae bacterium]|nr:hypothetical protein [Rubinisphaera sp.]HCS50227.1 hypothetical protein [Planctomycetaceae bacterium]|tara:strand:+ start:11120 stop:12226 length:1107 start_codon:yes stop_codon:yes gene_type:complete
MAALFFGPGLKVEGNVLKLFISEYICSGALAGVPLPDSLAREGLGMLRAICEDAVSSEAFEVCTTLDHRLNLNVSGVQCHTVRPEAEEWLLFQELAQSCDLTLVIAPEFNQILLNRVRWLSDNDRRHGLSDIRSIEIASDKLKFANWAEQNQISIPPTYWIDLQEATLQLETSEKFHFPLVIKPQWGAGASSMALLSSEADFFEFRNNYRDDELGPFVIQPYIEGISLSTACLINPIDFSRTWTPLGRQDFSGFEYQGGTIPFQCDAANKALELAEKVLNLMPGLAGWIGFDFLYCPDHDEKLVLLEVNPRLTTSYLGYRQLTQSNLAAIILGVQSGAQIEWSEQPVQFRLEDLSSCQSTNSHIDRIH